MIAACATADDAAIRELTAQEPDLAANLVAQGGMLLAEFAANGNTEGVRRLLDLGVNVSALFRHGDGYWDLARDTTALHAAAWRMWPDTVKLLIERGAPVNARDGKGRTALSLAVKACVDSYWKSRRTPESVEALLKAGATIDGIEIPCGYDEVDELLIGGEECEELSGWLWPHPFARNKACATVRGGTRVRFWRAARELKVATLHALWR